VKIKKGAIIGFGNVGESFAIAANERKDIKIIAVSDIKDERLRLAAKKYQLPGFLNHKDLYDLNLDFVIISSTNSFHKEHVVEAAKHKVHILCEKPAALSMIDASQMVKAVKNAGVINVVNYSFRFTGYMNALKKFLESGKCGKILSIWSRRSRGSGLYSGGTRHWAVTRPDLSGGWAVHHASHSVDLMLWFGGKISSVYAKMHSTARNKFSEEIVWALLNFRNRATGVLGDSNTNYRDSEFGVICEKGSLLIDRNQKIIFKPETGKEFCADRRIKTISFKKENKLYNGAVLDYFINHLKEGRMSNIDLAEARESLNVCLAMRKSARSGRIIRL